MIDGSSIEGFVRIHESDQYLRPDLDSFTIIPWCPQDGKVARLICDVYNPDGTPFIGDPRGALRRALKKVADLGYSFNVGPECEFFLFQTDEFGKPTTATNDEAGYFDLGPLDHGDTTRREIVYALEELGFEIEASHHEVAAGQHEIDFKYADALTAALEAGLSDASAELPCDADGFSAAHDEDVDTWRITAGPWRATVTGYDYAVSAGHATGGTLSLLWHREAGLVLLSSVLDYRLVEPHNMQLTLQRKRHRPLTPRVEYIRDGVRYAQCYDVHASISVRTEGETVWADVSAALVDAAQAPLAEGAFVSLRYGFCPDCTVIAGRVFGACAEKTRLVLPVIAKDARVESETLCGDPEPIFFLTGGFGAREYLVAPDESGEFRAVIRV